MDFEEQYVDFVQQLVLNTNLDVNQSDSDGNTPLHFASARRKIDLVIQLLNFPNININLKNSQNLTPLAIAHFNKFEDVVKCLLEKARAEFEVCEFFSKPLWQVQYNQYNANTEFVDRQGKN